MPVLSPRVMAGRRFKTALAPQLTPWCHPGLRGGSEDARLAGPKARPDPPQASAGHLNDGGGVDGIGVAPGHGKV